MKIKTWQIIVIVVTLIAGTLLHFTYKWSGENKIVAIFSAVNESTWEHLKLVFFPMLIMGIIGYFVIGKDIKNYWTAQAIGIVVAIAFITIFFYTYTGIIGKNFAVLDIGSFVVAILLGEYVIYKLMLNNNIEDLNKISILLLISIFLSFLVYTFNPIKIQYFRDPIDRSYGVFKIKK